MTNATNTPRGRSAAAAPETPRPVQHAAKPKGSVLEVAEDLSRTPDQCMAQLAAAGVVGNARSLVTFAEGVFGELSLTECTKVLQETARGLNDGDLSSAVIMLSSQAAVLNSMFGELARRSALNMGQHMDASERYMRLALKAQGQCRATLETLANIKNPPVVFARQANINNGGQQQVNNGFRPAGEQASDTHASKPASVPNELIEGYSYGRTQVDPRTTAAAGRTDQAMEPLAAFNGASHGDGEGTCFAKRVEGRRASTAKGSRKRPQGVP